MNIICNILIDAKLVKYISGDEYDFNKSSSWAEFFGQNNTSACMSVSAWESINTKIMIKVVVDTIKKQILSYEPKWVNGENGYTYFNW
jgi:hypothetical protein